MQVDYNDEDNGRQQELCEERQYHDELADLQCAVNIWLRCWQRAYDPIKRKDYRAKYNDVKNKLNSLTGVKK